MAESSRNQEGPFLEAFLCLCGGEEGVGVFSVVFGLGWVRIGLG